MFSIILFGFFLPLAAAAGKTYFLNIFDEYFAQSHTIPFGNVANNAKIIIFKNILDIYFNF
jgi:hypothetical protein